MNEETEIKNILLEFLKEKGPLWIVVLSVVINVFIGIKGLFTVKQEDFKLYFWLYLALIVVATLVFFAILIGAFLFKQRISRNYTCQIIDEKDEYDLQERENGKIKVVCRQNLKIKALTKMKKFKTFYPLYGKVPTKFYSEDPDGGLYKVPAEKLSNENDGVDLHLRRDLTKPEQYKLPTVFWEYENLQSENAIRTTAIVRPTSQLEIFINLPLNKTEPKEYGWYPVNVEGESVGRSKQTKCLQVGDRFCLYTKIKVKEGLGYRIWWRYPS